MPFDWTNFLALAEELSGRADEASKRSAISRAYYYAFNLAFARAEATAGAVTGGEGSHAWCWNKYASTDDPGCRRIWLLGDRMKRSRIKADYRKDDIPRLDEVVQRTLEEAREVQVMIANLHEGFPSP